MLIHRCLLTSITVPVALAACLGVTLTVIVPALAQEGDSDHFFREGVVHTLELTLPYDDWFETLMLHRQDEEYVYALVTSDDEEYDSIGVRFKGNSSFMHPGIKKSLKLKFNHYIQAQRFFGMKTLNLSNGFLDPTFLREKLFLEFCAAQGIACPRATFADVIINGELLGFYTVVEQVNKDFIGRRWGEGEKGNLYKGDPRGNLVWQGPDEGAYRRDYSLETNEDEDDWSDLVHLIDVLNNTRPEELVQSLEETFDVADYLLYEAAGGLFVNLDAYRGSGHNYYIYHMEDDGRFRQIVWDCNEAFGVFTLGMNPDQIIGLDIFWSQPPPQSRPLLTRILPDPIYRTIYLNRVTEMVYGPFQPDSFFPRIHRLADMVRPHVRNDRNKMFSDQEFERGLSEDIQAQQPRRPIIGLERFVHDRREAVLSQLDRINFNPPLRINEVLADNHSVTADEEDEFEDGLELINMTDHPFHLDGVGLTDEVGGDVWMLPDTTVPAGGFIWIWCDGDEEQGELHASFRLNADGEQVLLFSPDGRDVWDYLAWRELPIDLSWGRFPDGAPVQRQMQPTPGEENLPCRPPLFVGTARQPSRPSPEDTVWVTTSLQADNPLAEVNLFNRMGDDEEWTWGEMFDDGEADDGRFGAALSPVQAGVRVEYYLAAEDERGLERFDPVRAPEDLFSYISAEEWDGLVINELQASNDSTIADPQGEYDDWIELFNGSEVTVYLSGFYLTDDLNEPDRWEFPVGASIEPGEFLIVWTDSDDGDNPGLHSNFRLSAEGEQLGLFVPDGDGPVVVDTVTFDQQQIDWSFGREVDGSGDWVEFENPTPGKPNNPVAVDDGRSPLPEDIHLDVPCPNPFNDVVRIGFYLPSTLPVVIDLYDLSGRCVRHIAEERFTAGKHLLTLDAAGLSSGVYLLCLEAGGGQALRKLVLVR